MLSIEGFRFGIEHEFAVVDRAGRFCDFANTTFEQLDRVVGELPIFEADYDDLRVGDLGIKLKRWYIEGFERFTASGEYLRTEPKGYEVRTPIRPSLDGALETLAADLARWLDVAEGLGYREAHTSFNPFQREYVPDPPLNSWERASRRSPEERTAHIHMLTYGPDISLSHPDLATHEVIEIGRKLTHYSPFLVPFSFTSPFFLGALWGGYSRRTYYRTGPRPSVLVHLEHDADVIRSSPTLTDRARLPAEVGRIEFKAFDCPPGIELYRALGTLLIGLALDQTLPGRALVPDERLHKLSARDAFDDDRIRAGAATVLEAARHALPPPHLVSLEPLEAMWDSRRTPAHAMIEAFEETGDVIEAIL